MCLHEGESAENEQYGWKGGFDCVLGNPPWDQIQIDPQEYFSISNPKIARIKNMSARLSQVSALASDDPVLYSEWIRDLRITEGVQHFIHESNRYRLTSFGRLNTAPLFAEMCQCLVSAIGQSGLILPTGIATDSFNQYFFSDIVKKHSLVCLYDFENRKGLFPDIDSRLKFCNFVTRGKSKSISSSMEFAFYLRHPDEIKDGTRKFFLTRKDIELLSPNTLTCPVFRSKRDANIAKVTYSRIPVLASDTDTNTNSWSFTGMLMFMINTSSDIFCPCGEIANYHL